MIDGRVVLARVLLDDVVEHDFDATAGSFFGG